MLRILGGAVLFVVIGCVIRLIVGLWRTYLLWRAVKPEWDDADMDAAEMGAKFFANRQAQEEWYKTIRSGKANLDDLLKILK